MAFFLNYKNGVATVDTARDVNAAVTDVADIIDAKDNGSDECLTATLDIFIKEEAEKIMGVAEKCETQKELDDFIFGAGDFLELMLENEFGILLNDYPDLREIQRQQFDHIEFDE